VVVGTAMLGRPAVQRGQSGRDVGVRWFGWHPPIIGE
jgi:hypothetical protein